MDLLIVITKNTVFDEVSKVTSFIGVKTPVEAGSVYDRFDDSQLPQIRIALFNYLVNTITARWLSLVLKSEVETYNNLAALNMQEIIQKLYSKQYPKRKETWTL